MLSLYSFSFHPQGSLSSETECEKADNAGSHAEVGIARGRIKLAPELSPGMAGRHTRNLIRILIGAALCVALTAATALPIPDALPAVAIHQASLYRLEVALIVFYGWLLLVTPAFSGLVRGRLPIEISTRGARFSEEAGQSTKLNARSIEGLKERVEGLAERQRAAEIEIKRLKATPDRDDAQPAVGSEK